MLMLSEILSRKECAECRICCCFDSYDIWEAPVISPSLRTKVEKLLPETEFVTKGGSFTLKMRREQDADLYYCNLLDRSRGCMLGGEKPFDCSIWPLRIMEFEGRRVIALSPVCPVVAKRPVKAVTAVAKKLAPTIFEQANKNPDLVKKYELGYVILVTEDKSSEQR